MVESKGMGKGKVVACHVDTKGNKAFAIDWEKDGAADRKYSASKVVDGAIGRVDPRVHDWVEGTTVESNGLGKGRVFACGLDKASYKEFTINARVMASLTASTRPSRCSTEPWRERPSPSSRPSST